jgi:hypothetical protein
MGVSPGRDGCGEDWRGSYGTAVPEASIKLQFVYSAATEPLLDDFVQTFHALAVLWAAASAPLAGLGRGRTHEERFRRQRVEWVAIDPPPLWVPVPSSLPQALELRVEALTMASPFDLLLHVPHEVYAAAGAVAIPRFVTALEKAWNAPGRIRVERTRLERDQWQALADRDAARDAYELRPVRSGRPQSGFELESGSVDVPDDWRWPS